MTRTMAIMECRAAVSAAATWLVGLRESMFEVGNAELGPFFRQVDDLSRQVEASMLTGQLLAPETIRRIACDATIIPVVLGTDSEVLDVGRARRLFTPGLLRAMWLRGRGCTIPGCTAPPPWADAHHIVRWSDGGQTSLLNEALLCRRQPPPRFAGGTPRSPTNGAGPRPPPPAKSPGTSDCPAPQPAGTGGHTNTPATHPRPGSRLPTRDDAVLGTWSRAELARVVQSLRGVTQNPHEVTQNLRGVTQTRAESRGTRSASEDFGPAAESHSAKQSASNEARH